MTIQQKKKRQLTLNDIMNLDICNVLQQCPIPPDVIKAIPFVPTGYHRVTDSTPHPWYLHSQCNHWLQPFWVNCLGRCKGGRQALMTSNRHRLSFNDTLPGNSNTLPIENQPIRCCDNARTFANQVSQGTQSNDDKPFSWFVWLWHFIFRNDC